MRDELWTIGGNWPYFEVSPTEGPEHDFLHTANDAAVNGTYPSRVAALESLIASLEDTRRQLSGQIARHKRALRRAQPLEPKD